MNCAVYYGTSALASGYEAAIIYSRSRRLRKSSIFSRRARKLKPTKSSKFAQLYCDTNLRERLMDNNYKYEIVIYWSKEDEAFIAEVPELPGCVADGATYAEAVANVDVIIQEWIEAASELGRPIPEPRGRLMYA
jgi:predicted RNase H-like HicB family nuclease